MSRRHTNRPVERLRPSAWTGAADLEETMKGMFAQRVQTGTDPGTGTVPVNLGAAAAPGIPSSSSEHLPQNQGEGASPVETGTVPDTGSVPFTRAVPVIGTAPDNTSVPITTSVPVHAPIQAEQRPRTRIFRATRVEHGHTPGERIILQALWTKAVGNDRERTIRIGYDRLASIASVNWKTARACLRSLEQKLAIETLEPENSNSREGRLYRVYGFDLILERRKKAGLEWVQKGRGVDFVQPGTVPSFTTVSSNGAVPSRGSGAPPDSGTEPVPVSGTLLRSSKKENEETTALRVALQAQLPTFDNAAVNQLWKECRHQVPDVTTDEVETLFRQKLDTQPRSIENQNGFLMRAVARSCTTATVVALRQSRESSHALDCAEERALYWQRRAAYWETLNDPHASEDEKRVARDALATMRETELPSGS